MVPWSKISLAFTLLSTADGWVGVFLWFSIVGINVVFGLGGFFNWIGCSPLEKNWSALVPGTCWDPWINIRPTPYRLHRPKSSEPSLAEVP